MWHHSKFIYFLTSIFIMSQGHVFLGGDWKHDKFIESISATISHLITLEVNPLKPLTVAIVGQIRHSDDMKDEILRRIASFSQVPVIVINKDAIDTSRKTALTENPWKCNYVVFHIVSMSIFLKRNMLDVDYKNRRIFVVIDEPIIGKPLYWNSVWIDYFYVYSLLKTENIHYMTYINNEIQLFTLNRNWLEQRIPISSERIPDRTEGSLKIAQYHNPPLSIIENDRIYGYDSEFVNVICKLLNISYELIGYSVIDLGILDNTRELSTILAIGSDYADFSFNTREMSKSSLMGIGDVGIGLGVGKLNGMYPLEITKVCAVVPRSEKYSTIRNIVHIFDSFTWLTIVLTFIALGLILFYLMGKSSLLDIYLALWEIQLLGATNQSISTKWNRSIFILFIIYNYLISSFFYSVLESFLTRPLHYPNFKTLAELNRSAITLHMTSSIAMEIRGIRGEEYIFDNYEIDSMPFGEMIQRVDSKPNSGFVTTENFIRVFMDSNLNRDSNGETKYHIVKECYYDTYRRFLMNQGNPFEDKINLYQSWVTESGLFIHWMSSVEYNFSYPETGKFYAMTFRDYIVAFYILFYGYILAAVVFLVEVLKKIFKHS